MEKDHSSEQEHARLRELFVAACDLSESEQEKFLEKNCSSPHQRSELERLLSSDLKTNGIFSSDNTTDGLTFNLETVFETKIPRHIGKFEIKEVLGEGGMGSVYLARQENPSRDVAVKVIRSGMPSPELVRRFKLEADFQGRLTHPGIVQIYEAGIFKDDSSGQNRPFLAMEFVDGIPLRKYAQKQKVGTRECLELIIRVCNAVHHAHQRGVIHRDLKPGNIMVKQNGQPVILDFGVARATETKINESTAHTQTSAGQLLGTLAYMSPEQAKGTSKAVDTRSDVYSLGVIVYELLSDQLPYEIGNLDFLEAVRTISEENPTPLVSHGRKFRGDLNTIVLKTLEKEPDRRYQSAAAFGEDIQRYLNDEPIKARVPTTFYQLRQFSKRNKALVGGLLASITLLVGGVIGTTLGMMDAQTEANRKNAINTFMKDILVANDATEGNPNAKMLDVLREAAENVPERFGDHPELEADICEILGDGFSRLTLQIEALPMYRRAFEIRKEALGIAHPLTLKSGAYVAKLLVNKDASETIKLVDELLSHTPANELLQQSAISLRLSRMYGNVRLMKLDAAEQEVRTVLAELKNEGQNHEGQNPTASIVRQLNTGLATTLARKVSFGMSTNTDADLQESIQLFRDAIEESAQQKGEGNVETLQTKLNLIDVLQDAEELNEAKALCKQVIESAAPLFDPEHAMNTRPKKELSKILYLQDEYTEAGKLRVEFVELMQRRQGSNNLFFWALLSDAIPIVEAGGQFEDGEVFARMLLEKNSNQLHEGTIRLALARMLSGQGRVNEADAEFKNALKSNEVKPEDPAWDRYFDCLYQLFMGEHILEQGEPKKALEMFKEALHIRSSFKWTTNPRIARIDQAISRAEKLLQKN